VQLIAAANAQIVAVQAAAFTDGWFHTGQPTRLPRILNATKRSQQWHNQRREILRLVLLDHGRGTYPPASSSTA